MKSHAAMTPKKSTTPTPKRYRPLTDAEVARIIYNSDPSKGKLVHSAIRAAHRAGAMGRRGPGATKKGKG